MNTTILDIVTQARRVGVMQAVRRMAETDLQMLFVATSGTRYRLAPARLVQVARNVVI